MTSRNAIGPWSAYGRRSLVGASLAASFMLGAGPVLAVDVAWDNDADPDTNWTTDANWDGDTAPTDDATTDTAVFGVKGVLNDPTLDTDRSVAGVNFTDVGWSLNGGSTLTVGAGGIDSAGAGTNAIDGGVSILMADDSTWTAGAGNTLNVGGAVNNGGNTLTVDGAGTTTFDGVISGSGGLDMNGPGDVNLNGANTYTGVTTIGAGAGTVTIGAAGSITSQVDYGGGVLIVDGTLEGGVDISAAGLDIGGTGTIIVDAIGILSTSTAPTTSTVAATLSVVQSQNATWGSDPGNTLVVEADVDNAGHLLTVAGGGTTTFDGVISGAGGLTLNAPGTLNLNGVNTYTGLTTLAAGTTNIVGTVAGDVTQTGGTVNLTGTADSDYDISGGTLGGTGTIGGNLTATGGTVDVGSSIGTMTVQGNFDLGTGATLSLELDKTAGTNDLLDVTGTAAIADDATISIRQTDAAQVQVGDMFTFITAAGGLTLDVDAVNLFDVMLSGVIGLTFTNDGNNLIGTAGIAGDAYAAAAAGSDNPGIGASLDSLNAANPTDPLIAATSQLSGAGLTQFVNDTDAGGRASAQAPAAAALAGSQSFVGHQTAYLAARRSGAPMLAMYMDPTQSITSPILAAARTDPAVLAAALEQAQQGENADGKSAPMVDNFPDPFVRRGKLPPSPDQPYGGYLKGVGLLANQDSESGRAGYSLVGGGMQGGVDAQLNDQWIGGLSLGYTHSQVDLSGGLGDIDVHSIRFGPYASYQNNEWFFDGSASFGYHLHEATRTTALGDADADYDAWDATLYGGVGYGLQFGRITLTPTASVQYTYFNREAYTESGPGALSMSEEDTHTLHGRVGGTWSYVYEQTNGMTWVPEFSVGWQHEFLNDDDPIEASFAGGGAGFSIQNKGAVRDAMYMGGGLSLLLDRSRSLFVRYDGTFSDSHDAHALSVGLTLRF